jgi:hypothetical protein
VTPEGIPVPLSALEHYAYCPRQAGLILLEDGYADDMNTVRGTLLHRRVHEPGSDSRPGVRTLRALPVWHDELGLVGVCDVVELDADGSVRPVEYKSGSYVAGGPADVQVGAQDRTLGQPAVQVAAALRGGRGSQRLSAPRSRGGTDRGGRPSRRPRIATSPPGSRRPSR